MAGAFLDWVSGPAWPQPKGLNVHKRAQGGGCKETFLTLL
jgi:hypothetical protein